MPERLSFLHFFPSVFKRGLLNFGGMQVNVIWDKLARLVVFLLFIAGLLAVFFWYLPLIQQNQRYRKEILLLDTKIDEQERLARQLKAQIDAVLNDPRTLERLAREKLGWARTNETVIRFEKKTPPSVVKTQGSGF
jgi:cell division protein FtsB